MKPNSSNPTSEEQNSNKSDEPGMTAPEAASKRDAEVAERKAEEADAKAEVAQEMAEQEAERVHQELRSDIEDLEEYVAMLDRLVNKVYQIGETRDDEPALNSEMPHVVPENREPEDRDKSLEEVFTDE